ncbi:PQQ-dependent sugar dehydrogenase [Eudoraea chungangensis]|uniref:PQQ-dependent sugar dehydrogenase n=1 Tax=Eudoraea chungangensis TaxID=1481905 RepID=UPI0023EBC0C8|nr:PQQ-dependent sugar dehydrogenase [Eudoraea chungangensis]
MDKSTKFVGLLLFIILVTGCTKKIPDIPNRNYIAQLELDSTILLISEVVDSLEVPWDIEEGPDNWLWFTEQKGTINRVHLRSGQKQVMWKIPDVYYRKSTGLASMVLHPEFKKTPHLFVHYVYAQKDKDFNDIIASKIVRFTLAKDELVEPLVILDSIPGNTFHNGSRMMITEDLILWIGTGDVGNNKQTQDINTLNGKVLRINLDGSLPADNIQPNSAVWSVGHRNIQGITEANEKVYISEHGPLTDDEINIIQKGNNYGWPDVHGFCDLEPEKEFCKEHSIREPIYAWTPTLGTAGLAYYNYKQIPEWENSLLLVTLKAQSIRVLKLDSNGGVKDEKIFLQKTFGRLRDVEVGSRGEIYVSNSNLDWHPGHQPWMYDSLPKRNGDKILRIEVAPKSFVSSANKDETFMFLKENPEPFALLDENWNRNASDDEIMSGQKLYFTHCAACHRPDGKGNLGQIPPMINSDWVSGDKSRLIDVMLLGLSKPIEVDGIIYEGEMPAYKNLSDTEIADILNYIRVEFGSSPGNIIAADVLHQRKGL